MNTSIWTIPLIAASATSLVGAPSQTVYAIAGLTDNSYQLGSFDLANPQGTLGSYVYSWNSIGSPTPAAMANISRQPTTGELYLQLGFDDFQSVGTDGTTIGSTIELVDTYFGMTFGASGLIYGLGGQNNVLDTVHPTIPGMPIASLSLTPFFYSQFGGGLTATVGDQLYFANLNYDNPNGPGELYAINPQSNSVSLMGNLIGEDYLADDWMALFAYNASLYLLNNNRVYLVNTADASLTKLGWIENLPAEFNIGFAGAVGNVVAPVPEPSTYGLLLAGLSLALAAVRRKRMR